MSIKNTITPPSFPSFPQKEPHPKSPAGLKECGSNSNTKLRGGRAYAAAIPAFKVKPTYLKKIS